MKHIANALASQGRGPDTELVHMTKDEVKALASLGGLDSLPKNPKTGLPEAGLLSMVLPIAAAYMTGGQSLWLQAAAGAAAGGIGAGLEGGNMMRGALMGGATAGLTGAAKAAFTPGGAQLAETAVTAPSTSGVVTGVPLSAAPIETARGSYQGITPDWGTSAPLSAAPAIPQAVPTAALQTKADLFNTNINQFTAPTVPQMPANASLVDQATRMAAANPKTALGLGALGAYGLSQAMQPAPLPTAKGRDPYAGKATSGITASGVPVTYGGAENVYFTNNTPTNFTAAPSYAEGGQVQSGDLFNAPLMPEHQRQQLDPSVQYAQGGVLNLQQHSKHMDPMFLKGSGDGMSDSIDAQIDGGGKRPAEPIKVANNEYIIPADVVSHLGNGSSDAGAKKLDKMATKVRKARTGKVKQAPQIKAERYMPA